MRIVFDRWVANLLIPLALWVLLNGLDDLIVDFAAIAAYIRQAFTRDPGHVIPTEEQLDSVPPRLMAIFVALWQEHTVVRKMLDNNIARLRYDRVVFFCGTYPNDPRTISVVREAMSRYPNVQIAACPHGGPTSKADCLNWIYQQMLLYEEERGVRFDMILTHDAEDVMDPDGLRWINYFAQWYDFVQIPVLALPTPLSEWAHGVYCDEFAEFEFRDMPSRQILGGFIPSNGVGTGFSRRALEMLAERYRNRVFEPGCMTEDYENGFRVCALGLPQKFIPIQFRYGRAVATREYFPREAAAAIRQRARWVMGIGLQSWEFHSARETLRYAYWFWRDRKALVGNLVTPLTNVLFLYGAATWGWARTTHHAWDLARYLAWIGPAASTGLVLQAGHTAFRFWCAWRVYGLRFACGVPPRVLVANWINCLATLRAIRIYFGARLRGQPLRWIKTQHAYPSRAALLEDRKTLAEVLTGSLWVSPEDMEAATATKPEHVGLGAHLVQLGLITDNDLCAALALQNKLEMGKPEPEAVSPAVARMLPAAVARKWKVLPYRIAAGEVHVASPEPPGEDMQADLRRFSSLEIRVRLVTETEFEEMAAEYLG